VLDRAFKALLLLQLTWAPAIASSEATGAPVAETPAADVPVEYVKHLFDIEGLVLPSDVVVSGERIYIVDGGSHRIVVTDQSGKYLFEFNGTEDNRLNGPVGITTDSDGRIYVCDSGNGRVQIFDGNGDFIRLFDVKDEAGQTARPIDLLLNELRDTIYISDGSNHKILAYSTKGQFVFEWGQKGKGNREFRFPATLDMDSERMVYVVDILNTRVQRFTETGEWNANIADWGVLPGNLFRPKGVSLDHNGLIYVTDSYMDVIQVFNDQQFLYALGDESDKPRKFTAPGGIHINQNRIYVVEMFAKKVGVYELE
jgi:DNA-binding beta-propeller fold protein YncE